VVAPQLKERYVEPGIVRIVWHDFAWIGEESRQAAQAARCAGRQGKFWEYHDHLYGNQRGVNQGQFAAGNLRSYATQVGLEPENFGRCLEHGPDLPNIRQELVNAREQGVNATPLFRINGRPLVAGNIDAFARAIEEERARVGR
jgi:protein-disulfide isomerase